MGKVIDECVAAEPVLAASRDEIEALQLKKLKWAVRYAYDNVPMYKNKYDGAGVHPDDLKHLDDLAKFPFTTKEDLRKSYPFDMFAVPMKDVVRIHASSGTTGKPTVVGYTKGDIDIWANLVARCIRVSGGKAEHKLHVAYGYGLFTGGLGAHYGAEKLGCSVIPMSGGQTEKQVQMILDFKPEIIMVTPSYMLALADAFTQRGLDARDTSLQVAIHGAEPWSEEMRQEIERRFDIDAVDIYGLSELMGPGVANECVETKDGAHIWEDAFLPEIVDPDTFAPLADGLSGEFVLTALFKQAMPIIRYRTKDLTRLLPGTAFTHRRFERINARTDDMMIIRGVNVFPSQIEEIILQEPALSPHYQITLFKKGRMDAISVAVEGRKQSSDVAVSQAVKDVGGHIKARIGISALVEAQAPGSIPRSQGKAVRVIDKRV
ncbi:MAG: phenylacetate--CoA ligase [Robiginitomaculum sp.]|nr:MAG: phenylacetate--CoA ligase [Robiginitomaculum sp.]